MHRATPQQSSYVPGNKPRLTAPTKPKWTLTVEVVAGNLQADDDTPTVLLSTPIVDDASNTLYYAKTVRLGSDEIIAVDSLTGKQQWVRNLTGFRDVYGSYPTGVVMADGSVLASDRSGVYRLAANGTELWRNTAEDTLTDDVQVTSTGLVISGPLDCSPIARRGGLSYSERNQMRREGRLAEVRARVDADMASRDKEVDDKEDTLSSAASSYTYFAYRIDTGAFAWGVTLPSSKADFCSDAMIGPAVTEAEGGPIADGGLWVTTSAIDDSSNWWAINFNMTHAWVVKRASGNFPAIGNPDIDDDMNTVLVDHASGNSTILFPYFKGAASCWPYCPPNGVVVLVDAATGQAVTQILNSSLCDGIGECGAFSTGYAPASADTSRIFVTPSSGVLMAFAPTDLVTPVWTYNASAAGNGSNPGALLDEYVPVISDGDGNVYVAWGNDLAAIDVNGNVIWEYTLAGGAVFASQPAFGSDGTIYATTVADGNGAGPLFTIMAL